MAKITLSAYLADGGRLNNSRGKRIGSYKVVASWKTPKSYVSSRMYQVGAMVNNVVYTGRSAGVGMLFNGKRKVQ